MFEKLKLLLSTLLPILLIMFSPIIYFGIFKEISRIGYLNIKDTFENCPIARPLILKSYEDGKISEWEYNIIRDFENRYNFEEAIKKAEER